MHQRLVAALLFVLAGIPIGLLGAAAFHPDGAWLLESEAVWRVFGIYAYLGILVGPPLAVTVLVMALRRPCRRTPLP